MIVIYAGLAFLFFKIFPVFAEMADNTVLGAAVMAVTSAAAMGIADAYVSFRVGDWLRGGFAAGRQLPSPGVALAAVAMGIGASVISTYLVAAGFSAKLFRGAFGPFRAEPFLFWAMAAIPPFTHAAITLPGKLRGIAALREIADEALEERRKS